MAAGLGAGWGFYRAVAGANGSPRAVWTLAALGIVFLALIGVRRLVVQRGASGPNINAVLQAFDQPRLVRLVVFNAVAAIAIATTFHALT